MLNACGMQSGVGDGVESVVEDVILVRKLVEYAEFAQHRNMFGLRGCEQDPGTAAFEAPNRVGEHLGAGGVNRRNVAHAEHDNLDRRDISELEEEIVRCTKEEGAFHTEGGDVLVEKLTLVVAVVSLV